MNSKKKLNLLSLQDEVKMDLLKHAWMFIHRRLPAGIMNNFNEMIEQHNLRQTRILIVPVNMGLNGMGQFDVKLAKTVNQYGESLNNILSKTTLLRKTKLELISNYAEDVICNNAECKECRVV